MLSALLSLSGFRRKWPQLTEEEIRRHNTRSSLWIVSGNSVYDVTDILYSHPGGDLALLRRGGGSHDCATDHDFHSRHARRQWAIRKVGEVVPQEEEKVDVDAHLPCCAGWCDGSGTEDEGDGELAVESRLARARQQQAQQEAARGKSAYMSATVKVLGTEDGGGIVEQAGLRKGNVCMCPRCGRFAE